MINKMKLALGQFSGISHINKFGSNPSVGTSYETVWDYGGLYPWLTTATQLDVTSSATTDGVAGTGALTIQLQGLDADFRLITETVTMNGTTIVTTTKSFYRVFRAKVLTAGTSQVNDGNITIVDTGGSTVHAYMQVGAGQTLMALYTIPYGKQGLLFKGTSSSGQGKDIVGGMFTRSDGGAWNLKHEFNSYQNVYNFDFTVPLVIPEKTDIDIRAVSSVLATPITATFDLLLVNK